jgi:hypothetical protein
VLHPALLKAYDDGAIDTDRPGGGSAVAGVWVRLCLYVDGRCFRERSTMNGTLGTWVPGLPAARAGSDHGFTWGSRRACGGYAISRNRRLIAK